MWSLDDDPRLSRTARAALAAAEIVLVSPISFFEIAQKVRLGKWPEMEPFVQRLPALLTEQGGTVASFDPDICIAAGTLAWSHHDPFDRLLAATVLRDRLALLSADAVFDAVLQRVW